MMRQIGYLMLVMTAVIGVTAGICSAADVVINEIAWAGTAASANDEWIELHNTTDVDIDLSGWILRFGTDSTVIHFGAVEGNTDELRETMIEARGYYLLERTDDTTVSDVEADLLYKGNLANNGMLVELVDAGGAVVDLVDGASDGWPAGLSTDDVNPYATMERALMSDGESAWLSCTAQFAKGEDAEGNRLSGTPRAENSHVALQAVAPHVEWATSFVGPLSGTAVLEWTATDPDGSSEHLQISIRLYSNNREEINPIISNLANAGSYAWDTTTLPDGEYELEIGATDSEGFTSYTVSSIFQIQNGP